MVDIDGPTLAEDEATLGSYAEALANGFAAIARDWLHRLVEQRAAGLTSDPAVAAELEDGAQVAVDELTALLAQDIGDQGVGPLEILRRAVRFPTAILRARDLPEVPRDEFARTNFPDDTYNLTPASFADVHPSLHEPGLLWGAAKAHVHLRRRREAPPQ